MPYFLFFIPLLCLSLACQQSVDSRQKQVQERPVVQEKLLIPDSLELFANMDGVRLDSTAYTVASYKCYLSIDASCATCYEKIDFWIKQGEVFKKYAVQPVIVLRSKDQFRYFKLLCRKQVVSEFSFPFVLDYRGIFESNNHIGDAAVLTDTDNTVCSSALITTAEELTAFLEEFSAILENIAYGTPYC